MLQAQRPSRDMKLSLAISSFLVAALSYGADFSPDERLALGTSFREIERIFPGRKEAYISTNESGLVESGLVMVSFNETNFWDSVMLDIKNSRIAAASYVNAIHPFLSLTEVQAVLECLKAKFGIPADRIWLYTFDRLGPVCSPAYGWDVGEHYVVFAHSPFGYTSNGSHFQCQMTVMPSRRNISQYFDLSEDALNESERAAKIVASGKNSASLHGGNVWLGRTPLMKSAINGNLDEVKALLKNGADVMEMDRTGATVIDLLREMLRRIAASQPEAKVDYAARLSQNGFLEKDVRQLLRIVDEAARDLPKDESRIEAMKQVLCYLESVR